MRSRIIFLILIVCFQIVGFCQVNDYAEIDQYVRNIPKKRKEIG